MLVRNFYKRRLYVCSLEIALIQRRGWLRSTEGGSGADSVDCRTVPQRLYDQVETVALERAPRKLRGGTMMKAAMLFMVLGVCCSGLANAAELFEKDVIKTTAGNLEITFIGHGSLMMKFGGEVIHVDL